jgi:aspartate/methionine/tyrosine aminotransferase
VTHLRDVPLAGMNFVLAGAAARGFTPGDPEWINLGQGQPEIGSLPGAPERITGVALDPGDHAYGPVNGTVALRTAVADHYNRLYRAGRDSRYTAANVAIVPGGRPGLNRAVTALGHVGVGYLRPDYAAYEDILDRNTPRITPVAVTATGPDAIAAAVADARLGALLMSNPRNPTGEVLAGDDLRALVAAFTDRHTALIVDEFYSHFVYEPDAAGVFGPAARPVSAAEHVEDVDRDPVLIIDGVTKNLRYPGWRLGWVIGPRDAISVIERVGQAMDGGTSQVVQRAALAALDPAYIDAETAAVRTAFAAKRNLTVAGLRAAGIRIETEPRGTFYVWGSLADLPDGLRSADAFFTAALEHRVITVPGHAFHIDPGRDHAGSDRFDQWVRFSYGPPAAVVETGLARLARMTG